MWARFLTVSNVVAARMWQEMFEAEGVSSRIVVEPSEAELGDFATHYVYVPRDRVMVIEEILRNC